MKAVKRIVASGGKPLAKYTHVIKRFELWHSESPSGRVGIGP
jgi:hypothetical protein